MTESVPWKTASGNQNRAEPLRSALLACLTAIWPAYLLASVLILWGFQWSLPDNVHIDKSFHADENAAVWGVGQIHFPGFNPHLFNWGTAILYQVYALKLLFTLGGLTHIADAKVLLIGRLVVWLAALGTLSWLYLLAREIFDEWTAKLAAIVLGVMPGFVINSHYFKTDIPMLCWLTAAMFAGFRLINTGNERYVYALGLLTGYSISNKYSAVAVIPAAVLCIALSSPDIRKLRAVLIFGAFLAAGFLIGTPRVLPDPREFLHVVRMEARIGIAPSPWAFARGPGWVDYLTRVSRLSMTTPLWVVACIGVVWLIVKRARAMSPIILFLVAYSFLLDADNNRMMRYTVPVLPFAAVAVAGLLGELRSKGASGRWAAATGAFILTGYSLLFTASYVRVMTEEDPRIQASNWIAGHASLGEPFPVSTSFYLGAPQIQLWGFKKLEIGTDLDALRSASSPYVAVSEYLTEKYDGALGHYPAVKQFFDYIDANYTQVAHFENSQHLFGIDSKQASVATHDWLYPNPRITIYRRRQSARRGEAQRAKTVAFRPVLR